MADVGIAWADRFPRLSLSFTAGVENNTFTRFFTGPYWYPVIDLTSPLFAFGKNKARYQAAIEAYNQEKYQYEEKVLEVFKEVNDAVTSYRSAHEKVALMGNLKDASRKYVELALFQYQNGYTNYMDVLDAQRSYFDAEIDYSNSVRDEFLAIIDLYKALGGGWSARIRNSKPRFSRPPPPVLQRSDAVMPHEKPAEVAGVDIPRLGRYLLDRHPGIQQQILHRPQPAFGQILLVILPEVPLEKPSGVFRGKMEFSSYGLQCCRRFLRSRLSVRISFRRYPFRPPRMKTGGQSHPLSVPGWNTSRLAW